MSFICILIEASIFGDFSNIYQSLTKTGMTLGHLNRYKSKKINKIFQNFMRGRDIDEWKGVPSFASIVLMLRTSLKKILGVGRTPSPPGGRGVCSFESSWREKLDLS